ncbi:MAG: hypothetical protein ACK559_03455, partial [bacterium]
MPLQVVAPDDHVYYPVLLMGIGRWPGHFREHRRRVRWYDCRAGIHRVLHSPGFQPLGTSARIYQRYGVAALTPVDFDPHHELSVPRRVECSISCCLVRYKG